MKETYVVPKIDIIKFDTEEMLLMSGLDGGDVEVDPGLGGEDLGY